MMANEYREKLIEIERIFNNARYKYLDFICLYCQNNNQNPQNYISSRCNTLFKALAHFPIRNARREDVLKKNGFNSNCKINLTREKEKLDAIIRDLRCNFFKNVDCDIEIKKNIYKELIAIKPGLHEVFIDTKYNHPSHRDGLKKSCLRSSTERRRLIVLKMIHNIIPVDTEFNFKNLNREINSNNYFTYATCSITEGPFVLRKDISVSYFDEIIKIKSPQDIEKLNGKFYIIDYRNIASINDLKKILEKAKNTNILLK